VSVTNNVVHISEDNASMKDRCGCCLSRLIWSGGRGASVRVPSAVIPVTIPAV